MMRLVMPVFAEPLKNNPYKYGLFFIMTKYIVFSGIGCDMSKPHSKHPKD